MPGRLVSQRLPDSELQRSRIDTHLLHERVRSNTGQPSNAHRDLVDRLVSGRENDRAPFFALIHSAFPDRRDQPRVHERRLPAPRRTDHHKEVRLRETGEELGDDFFAAEEQLRILGLKCFESFVWGGGAVERGIVGRSRNAARCPLAAPVVKTDEEVRLDQLLPL